MRFGFRGKWPFAKTAKGKRVENRKKRKTSIHGACSANRPAKSRAVMMRVDL
jgi:hypothetical protein